MNLVVADATLGNDSALATALFDLLKNTRELEYMAHQFHWNIVGVKFNTMHEFYEEEYKQLFEDQDEIAEQIRQQGFFVPVINNVLLEENYSASGFEEQLIAYSGKLTQNIELIDKANDLAKNEIAVQDLCARLKGLRSLSLNLKVKAMLGANKMSLESSEATASAEKVTAGFDKGRYKEIDEESKFFKILKNDCDIRPKNFYAINKGLRLAIKVIKGTFEDASIRFFALKNKGGYVRVELKDNVYIVGYTIYESGKIKVWTRELKTNVPVNSFDYDMLSMYAKPFGTKMIRGLVPTWMSI